MLQVGAAGIKERERRASLTWRQKSWDLQSGSPYKVEIFVSQKTPSLQTQEVSMLAVTKSAYQSCIDSS
jgi:hypothetical protein